MKRTGSLTARRLLAAYEAGRRSFSDVCLDGVDLSGADLTGASFLSASMKGVDLTNATLTYVQLKMADLTGGRLSNARLNATDLIGASFQQADLRSVDLTGACLSDADLTGADLRSAYFNNLTVTNADFKGANLEGAILSHAHLDDVDVTPFCDASGLDHSAPSFVDARTVMRSHKHQKLKTFMVECGVPEIFADYMIDCARALSAPLLKSLMQSTFISYGGPDERFARKLYEALRSHNVVVFFFPESARLGERIDSEVYRQLQDHDRVLLVCSRASLNQKGVLNEIQETLDREARDGGATYLLPVMLDDYLLNDWRSVQPELAERIGKRIVGDFRKAHRGKAQFDRAMQRVLDSLRKKRPLERRSV